MLPLDSNAPISNAETIICDIREQVPAWFRHLNIGYGVLAFSLALGSLGTAFPRLFAAVSLFFIMAVAWSTRHRFPSTIAEFRAKKEKSEFEAILLKGIEAHFFRGGRSFLDTLPYYAGMAFLFAVIAGLKDALEWLTAHWPQ